MRDEKMKKSRSKKKRTRESQVRGIYVVPNLVTSANLFAGFYSFIATYGGQFRKAAIAIIIAVVLDGLDGKIARATNTTSRFGVEYDSLVDLVSFGVAPGFLIYAWALSPYGRIGWLAAFLFVVCGALRLARFNIQVDSIEKKKFNGLPIPAAASLIASMVLLFNYLGGMGTYRHIAVVFAIYILAFLMVSNIKYRSFKDLEPFKKRPFNTLVAVVLLLILLLSEPEIMIFVSAVLYIVSGPIENLVHLVRKGRVVKAEEAGTEEKGDVSTDGHDVN